MEGSRVVVHKLCALTATPAVSQAQRGRGGGGRKRCLVVLHTCQKQMLRINQEEGEQDCEEEEVGDTMSPTSARMSRVNKRPGCT